MNRAQWPGNTPAGRTWLIIDGAAILVLGALLGVVLLPVYGGGWLWVATLGGTLLGAGLGLLGAWRRLNAALVAAIGVGAYLLLGGLLAMPDSNLGYVVPTGRTLLGLLRGPVTAWKAMLTIEPPLGTTGNLMTVPLLLAFVSAAVAASISLRTRRPAMAWLPQSLVALLGFGLGVNYSMLPYLVAVGWAAVVLVWTTYRRRHARTALVQSQHLLRWPAIAVGAAVLTLVSGLTAASYPLLTSPQPRQVLRHAVEQPLDLQRYPSPLQGYRLNLTDDDNEVLFTISGAPGGSIVRVATMDAYDGVTFNVSNSADSGSDAGMFRRIGARIATTATGTPLESTITIRGLTGPWVPLVGQATDVDFTGARRVALSDNYFHNTASGTGLASVGLNDGDTYRVASVVANIPTDDEIRRADAGQLTLPDPVEVPDRLRDDAATFTAGAQTRGEAAQRLESRLKEGYYSDGIGDQVASRPGHSYSRLNDLLADPTQMVGNDEQYAATMALMARVVGIPARVVYGYEVPAGGASAEVRGSDVGAWTEVYLTGLGWVRFDPTPPKDRVLTNPNPPDPPELRPHVDSPPPPPERPEVPPPDNDLESNDAPTPPPNRNIDLRQVFTYTAVIGLPALLFIGVPVLILGLKRRRRRARENDPDLTKRFAGGWAELLDNARDLSRTPSASATRSEQAVALGSDFDRLAEHADPILLARQADAAVFSPDTLTEEQAAGFWRGIDGAVQGLKDSVTQRRWLRGRLSTRSFRRVR